MKICVNLRETKTHINPSMPATSIPPDPKHPETREFTVKSALHYHENEMPCNWDVNIYRGCGHGCRYCFAQYSHDYLGAGNFFDEIYAKINVAAVLDRELSRRKWGHARINLSGVTDAYQPAEIEKMIMPDVWKALIRNKNPVIITTKSSLILRDIELIRELAGLTSVYVNASITILDETLRKTIEPGAAPAEERFKVLEQCREAGCITNVMLTPVLPLINDDRNNLEGIYRRARQANVAGLSAWPLNLRGSTKQKFFRFLEAVFPHLVASYRELYRDGELSQEYWDKISILKAGLQQEYDIPSITIAPTEKSAEVVQLSLF
ncbi:MAG: radical SAM protein [Bacteroidota bacterium]